MPALVMLMEYYGLEFGSMIGAHTCRDHMYESPRAHVRFAEIICTIRREHMYKSPRSYVPFADIICTSRRDQMYDFRRDQMYNSPRSDVQFRRSAMR